LFKALSRHPRDGALNLAMIAIPIRYRRSQRALFAQKLQHAIPSIVVLTDGLEHLSHEPTLANLALGGVEVVASVLVVGSVIRGFRTMLKETAAGHANHAHAHGVDWIDISLGVMLLVEAYSKYHASGRVPRPTLLLAAVMFVVGSLHGRLAAWGDRRRELRVGPDGISLSYRKFARMTLAWSEVASIEVDDRYATVTATDGRSHRINLHDAFHPQAIRDALLAANTFLDAARLANEPEGSLPPATTAPASN
jgi:hypothetical protein